MDGMVVKLRNTTREVVQDIGATNNISSEFLESLRVITHRPDQTTFLLTNAVFAMITAIILSIRLYLTHFSVFLRGVVWIIYAGLCSHMVMTYVRYSHFQLASTSQQQQSKSTCF